MKVTPEMSERARLVLEECTWCPPEESGPIAHQMVVAALGPETPREREQAKHIRNLEKVRGNEQHMARVREDALRQRVRELEAALNTLGRQRRIQRVLRALANRIAGTKPPADSG